MAAHEDNDMIDVTEYYMGRDKLFPLDFTQQIQINAAIIVAKVNQLLQVSGFSRRVVSGWRPPTVNASTPGAAPLSNHMRALACDLEDKDGQLDAWCLANLDKLEEIGLWLEDPVSTIGWCHVQCVAPHSGNRVFKR